MHAINYRTIRDLLFLLPAEMSHHLTLQAIGMAGAWSLSSLLAEKVPDNPVEVMGITFPNRVGLAAGLDKDAQCIEGLATLGFGFLEVGTVTPRPQPGNPRPRMFRLKQEQAIINRMGSNNEGVKAMLRRIRRTRVNSVLGVNIGKNFDTPIEHALDDYRVCLRRIYRVASYIVVNISSPNTEGLRTLQQDNELPRLLAGLKEEHLTQIEKQRIRVPLLVKIDPDLTDEQIGTLCQRLLEFEIDGVIVSNTTVDRNMLQDGRSTGHAMEKGGLSGAPLLSKANHALKITAGEVKGKMAIIGVGGITKGRAAAEKIRLGADLVQIYTGLIYQGPQLILDSVNAISAID